MAIPENTVGGCGRRYRRFFTAVALIDRSIGLERQEDIREKTKTKHF
jgi:hypothetical protein